MQVYEQRFHFEAYVIDSEDGATNAAGTGSVTIGPVPAGKVWFVERATSVVAGATAGTHRLYRNQALDPNLEDVSPITALAFTFVEWPVIMLQEGESLVVEVQGADATVDYDATIRARQMVRETRCITL
jgi:hypothetical protein